MGTCLRKRKKERERVKGLHLSLMIVKTIFCNSSRWVTNNCWRWLRAKKAFIWMGNIFVRCIDRTIGKMFWSGAVDMAEWSLPYQRAVVRIQSLAQNFIINIFTLDCWKDKNKEKRYWEWPDFFKKTLGGLLPLGKLSSEKIFSFAALFHGPIL